MFNYEMSVKSQQSKTTKRTIYFLLVTILYKLFYMYNNIVGQPVLFFSFLFCFVLFWSSTARHLTSIKRETRVDKNVWWEEVMIKGERLTTGSQSTFPYVSYQVDQQGVIHELCYDALKQELHITLRSSKIGVYSLSTELGFLFFVYCIRVRV